MLVLCCDRQQAGERDGRDNRAMKMDGWMDMDPDMDE